MCIMAPGQVLSVDAESATVAIDGRTRRALTLLEPLVQPGDWVIVAAGAIIERVDPERAAAMQAGHALATRDEPPGAATTHASPPSRPPRKETAP